MSSNIDERISDEIEALEAILMEDVIIKKSNDIPTGIEYVVHPSTGDDADQQYVCVTLEIDLTDGYPDVSPDVKLRSPRGLDDELIDIVSNQIKAKLLNCIGQPVVFELIELVRENLTASNLPSGQCVICLYNFSPGDVFTKTQCYHYFHSHCLSCHIIAGEKNHKEELEKLPQWQKGHNITYTPICPVCRSYIYCDMEVLSQAPPPRESVAAAPFYLTPELVSLQERMAALLAHQVSIGGVVTKQVGPPPLTITTAADFQDVSDAAPNPSSSSRSVAAPSSVPVANGVNNQKSSSSSDPTSPISPKKKTPYRGFNRRGNPNRRHFNNRSGRSEPLNQPEQQPCASTTR